MPSGWTDDEIDEAIRAAMAPARPDDLARMGRDVAAAAPPGSGRRRRRRIVVTWTSVAAALVIVAVAVSTTGPGDGVDSGPAQDGPEVPVVGDESVAVPVEGVDVSADLADDVATTREAAVRALGADGEPVPLSVTNVYPPPGAPELDRFPARARWRFSVAAAHREECRAMVTDALTTRGFAGELQRTPSGTFALSAIEFGSPAEAEQFLTGRAIALGVTPATCEVVDGEVLVDHRLVPGVDAPAQAEGFHSFVLTDPAMVFPGEQTAQGFLVRVGGRVWEVRLGSVEPALDPQVVGGILDALPAGG